MASQSGKKTASANSRTLKELHVISLVINVLVLLSLFVTHRPASKWVYVVFSIPAFGCQYVLEKSGRPVYSFDSMTGLSKLVRSGDDIKGPGLFEYMFDCIYVTWICDILMIICNSNKVWILFLVVPGFLAFKITSVAKSFMGSKAAVPVESSGKEAPEAASGKSKRQTKLEQRGQRQRVRAR